MFRHTESWCVSQRELALESTSLTKLLWQPRNMDHSQAKNMVRKQKMYTEEVKVIAVPHSSHPVF